MKIFSQIITAFCVSSIFIGVLFMLVPKGALSKSVQYILSLAFILSLLASAKITIKNSDFKIPQLETQTVNSQELQIENAKYVFAYALQKAGIDFKEIKIFTNTDSNNSIVINRIEVYSASKREEILSVLGEAGMNYEVVVINE